MPREADGGISEGGEPNQDHDQPSEMDGKPTSGEGSIRAGASLPAVGDESPAALALGAAAASALLALVARAKEANRRSRRG